MQRKTKYDDQNTGDGRAEVCRSQCIPGGPHVTVRDVHSLKNDLKTATRLEGGR